MDAKACRRKGGTWNTRTKECTRDIEMAVYLLDRTWYTTMIDIPIDTSSRSIKKIATECLTKALAKTKEEVSSIDLYWIPPLEV